MDTFYVSLLWLLWEQRQVRTVLTVLVSRDSTVAVPGQGVLALCCAMDRCRLVWTSLLLRRDSSPWFIFSCPWCSSRTRLLMSFTVPLNGWTIVCHCNCRYLVLYGVFASRCRVVVEVLFLIVLRFCLGQCEADDWKIHRLLFSVPRRRWVCMHAELLV